MTFVLAGVAPIVTWAVCTCGFQSGSFTLATIALDGDMSDWTAVLADPDNNVCDGPAGGLIDPDTPLLAVAASIDILIVYAVPAGVLGGDIGTIVTTAASDYQPLATDIVTDVITIALGPDLLVTKQGAELVDNDSVIVTDSIDAGLCMKVTDLGAAGSGPVAFQDGTPSSNLSYSFVSLGSATDDLEFSSDGGASFTYAPTANGLGCDPAITDIRILPQGIFAADTGSGSPQAEFTFRALVN